MAASLQVKPTACRDCGKITSDGAIDGYAEKWFCHTCLHFPDGMPKDQMMLAERCTAGYLASLVNQIGRQGYYASDLESLPYLVPKARKHIRNSRRQFYEELQEIEGVNIDPKALESDSDSGSEGGGGPEGIDGRPDRSRSREREPAAIAGLEPAARFSSIFPLAGPDGPMRPPVSTGFSDGPPMPPMPPMDGGFSPSNAGPGMAGMPAGFSSRAPSFGKGGGPECMPAGSGSGVGFMGGLGGGKGMKPSARPGDICHNCGEAGHFARDCMKPKEKQEVVCHKCNKVGHIARDCPYSALGGMHSGANDSQIERFRAQLSNQHIAFIKLRDQERVNGDMRVCNLCGQPGHIAKECLNKFV